jgi:hypothetical protein
VPRLPVSALAFVVGLICAGGIVGLVRVGIIVENSSVEGNTAATFAGGIHVQSDSTLRVTSTTVENNTAGGRGGEPATFCD